MKRGFIMTVEARRNLQLGVPEDRRFPATDYTSDGSFLDEYLIATTKARRGIMERYEAQKAQERRKAEEAQAQKELEAEVEKKAYKAVEKALDDIFKNWKWPAIRRQEIPFLYELKQAKMRDCVLRGLEAPTSAFPPRQW